MVDFRHLDAPRPAGTDDKWVVLAANDMFLILLKTGELEYGPDYNPSDYQFEHELDAHLAASYYYNQNKMGYPHADAMLNSADAYPLVFDDDDFIEDDQQTMEFV